MHHPISVLLVVLALVGCQNVEDPTRDSRAIAVASVTGDDVRQHMEILAADDMAGREAGTEGFTKAAEYVVEKYRSIGLVPIGDNRSYLQSVDFLATRLDLDTAALSLWKGGAELDLLFPDDFVCSGGFGEAEEEVTAPLVFVGHGIRAPEYDHDDFADVAVAGKILVMLSGAPPHFATDQRAFYSSTRGKQATAVALGAVGILTVRTPVDQARRPWARYISTLGTAGLRWLDDAGRPFEGFPELVGAATLGETGAEKLIAFTGQDLASLFDKHAAGKTGSFDMGVSVSLSRSSRQNTVTSPNVIGLLPGSDPLLRNEYVIYTAHLDHIGVRTGEQGVEIHNGAYDNAAGIATILEVAEAMAALATAPRRSVIFAAVTAEEKGLQGSSYLAKNPPVPSDQLVANLNIDMPYLAFPLANVEAFGAEHSTLEDAVRRATAEVGLELTPDSMPEQVRFVRSDQFSFVKEGVPALAFKAGARSSDPNIDGAAMLADFLKHHYHQPSDDLSLPFSHEGAEAFARAALLLGMIVADEDERPRWNDGDFFAEKFARSTRTQIE